MLLAGVLKQKYLWGHNIRDPLNEPDDPFNQPQLERHDLVKVAGLDFHHEEEEWETYKRFLKYWPKWLQWRLNPSAKRQWSVIRKVADPMDTREHDARYLKELEIAMHEGHERILIEPQSCANYASTWIRVGEHYHNYAYNYGLASIILSCLFPKWWGLYLPTSLVSIFNAYAYSRYWRTDRLHRYTVYEPEYEETDIESLMWSQGKCPNTYWMLKRQGRVQSTVRYISNQFIPFFACIWTGIRMGHIEEWSVGPTYRKINVDEPINTCEYFMPAFIDWEKAWPSVIPADVPKINGATVDVWFFVCLFAFYVWDGFQSLKPDSERPEVFLDASDSDENVDGTEQTAIDQQ